MSRFKFFLCMFALTAFLVGYGAAAKAYPAGGVHGRGEFRGYRTNTFDDSGTYVLRQAYWGEAIRPNVEGDVGQFISFILKTKLDIDNNGSADGQDKRGATFIIQTMLGTPTSQRGNRPTSAQIDKWTDLVTKYNDRGLIRWRVNYTYKLNSMFQGTHDGSNPDDDAFYDDSGTQPAILFMDPNNPSKVVYALKWACANPVGSTSLPDINDNFDMSATITSQVNGGPVGATTAEPGDTIRFTYTVKNAGPGPGLGIVCGRWKHDYPGYKTPPAWVDAGSTSMSISCPSTFNPTPSYAGVTINEDITPTTTGTFCRFLEAKPDKLSGGQARDSQCVTVYSKPYFRVYGGDVEAGANFAPSCSTPVGAGTIQAYNKGAAGSYAGSGAEGAVVAYGSVTEFVSAAMRSSGTPRTPKGLTFANNSAAAAYGGNFGAGSCIPDYWSLSASTGVTINPNGYQVLGRTLNAGDKQDVFVDGDVIIKGDIAYAGNWTIDLASNTIPSFRLIARGNIYIQNNVGRLDGTYIALPISNGTKGLIYTCSFGAAPPSQEQMAHDCGSQLRVNGAFIAKGVKLLRTANTLRSAGAAENSAATKAAEIFTYSPEVWLAKPQFKFADAPDYDSVTTLPPVL